LNSLCNRGTGLMGLEEEELFVIIPASED
jgi:hypothetical protein